MNDGTSYPAPAPEWAEKLMTALNTVSMHGRGDGRLTRHELLLADFLWMRLRQRLGLLHEGSPGLSWDEVIAGLWREAVAGIEREQDAS